MKGHEKAIAHLNRALRGEFGAIHQYFVHSEMQSDWGYTGLGGFMRKQSIDEMRHAEKLIERILFLEGIPGMADISPLKIGRSVKEQFENDLELELEGVRHYNQAIQDCVEIGDNGSRELFKQILVEEEAHVNWLESQLQMMNDMGAGLYLSRQLAPEGGSGGGAGGE